MRRPRATAGWGLVVCVCVCVWIWSGVARGVEGSSGVGLRIGAYNAQIWGQSKAGKPDVVSNTTAIVLRYDVVYFQEIRDAAQTAIFVLLDAVNEAAAAAGVGYRYDMVMSGRLGRTSSKEQSAFLFRNTSMRVETAAVFDESTLAEPDVYEREPYIVSFRVLGANASAPLLRFVGLHVKPDDAVAEIGNLTFVLGSLSGPAFVVGDLNADCSYLSVAEAECCVPLYNDPDYDWLIGWDVDTTVKATHCAYDRIIAPLAYQPYLVPDSARVFDFAAAYGLDQAQADDVSDHYPVEVEVMWPGIEPPLPPPPPPPPSSGSAPVVDPAAGSGSATTVIAVAAAAAVLLLAGVAVVVFYAYSRMHGKGRGVRKGGATEMEMQAYAAKRPVV